MQLTIAEIIDKLITTNIKCFQSQDKMMEINPDSGSIEDLRRIAELSQQTQRLNKRRSHLMQALDEAVAKAIKEQAAQVYDGSKTY